MSEAFKLAPHEWALLRSLLDEALAMPVAQRAAWLQALDEGRAQGLKPRLQALLDNATDDDPATHMRLLETLPKVETGQFAPLPGAAASEKPGDVVGPYRLIRELGSGGMGSVWLAERTDMLQGRQVALKLPHGAWKRAGLAERMAREREILATLEHPNIARLYDAGVTPEGQPWLALEYVAGERIDAHCRARQLGVKQRLQLFLQVARAVAHAHAQLVVHRDLKPANIIVTEGGDVKLLDFGIAKLVAEGVVEETELTREVGRAFTPEYASPEQILGRPLGTASDLYSLGVVFFELLADVRPYRLNRSSRAALEEAVAQADVLRPSALAPAERRSAVRGDLDTIVLKSLKREPSERYATVAALADDVQRHLAHQPVLAQPDGTWYRTRKFMRRHRLAIASAGAVLAAVLGGAGVSVWQARVAIAERERAEEVKTFVAELLRDANPAFNGGRKVTVDELLMTTRPKIEARFPDRPQIRAELLTIVGTSLASMGEHNAAWPLLLEAEAVAVRELGPDHVQSLHSRSLVLGQRQHRDPGPQVARDADDLIAAMRRNPQVDPAYFVNLLSQRGSMALTDGQAALAVAHLDEALRVAKQRLGETKEQTLNTAVGLALAHQRGGDWRRTLEAAREVHRLVFEVRKLPPDHFNAVDAELMLGMALADAGELAAGLRHLEAGVRQSQLRRKPTDAAVGSFRTHLARYQLRAGLAEEALGHYRAAHEIHRVAPGPKSRRYAATAAELALAEMAMHRPERAIPLLREAQAYFGVGSADTLARWVPARLAAALAATGQHDEARQQLPADAGNDWELWLRQAQVARFGQRPAEAAAFADKALAALPDTPALRVARAELLLERGLARFDAKMPDAVASLDESIDLLRRHQTQPGPLLAQALAGRGQALMESRERMAEATRALEEAAELWRRLDTTHPALQQVAAALQRARARP